MMSYSMKELLDKYIAKIKKIYGTHLQEVILKKIQILIS